MTVALNVHGMGKLVSFPVQHFPNGCLLSFYNRPFAFGNQDTDALDPPISLLFSLPHLRNDLSGGSFSSESTHLTGTWSFTF